MYFKLTFFFIFLGIRSIIAQNVGIGTNTPHASAILDITSTTKGLLAPRLTNEQMITMPSPANGLLIYNTDQNKYYYYQNTTWLPVSSSANTWLYSTSHMYNNPVSFNVGIGSNVAPLERLHIFGGNVTIENSVTQFPKITFRNNTNILKGSFGVNNNDVRLGTTAGNTGGYLKFDIEDAQKMVITSIGNVGIGSNTTPAESALLDLNSTSKGFLAPRMSEANRNAITSPASGLSIYNTTTNQFNYFNGTIWRNIGEISFWTANGDRIYNNNTESVGIGITNPSSNTKLQISGGNTISSGLGSYVKIGANTGSYLEIDNTSLQAKYKSILSSNPLNDILTLQPTGGDLEIKSDEIVIDNVDPIIQMQNVNVDKGFLQLAGDDVRIGTNASNSLGKFVIRTGGINRLNVDNSGNISIGTTEIASGYIVNVGGKMVCEELRVDLEADWPDYVFTDEYEVMELSDVEEYIHKNRHLPKMPSAKEIKDNGIQMGEMNRILVEKIEELTLHMIRLDKENKILANQIKVLTK